MSKKYVYSFDEGNKDMRGLLGPVLIDSLLLGV